MGARRIIMKLRPTSNRRFRLIGPPENVLHMVLARKKLLNLGTCLRGRPRKNTGVGLDAFV
jgi:hypothetical protein